MASVLKKKSDGKKRHENMKRVLHICSALWAGRFRLTVLQISYAAAPLRSLQGPIILPMLHKPYGIFPPPLESLVTGSTEMEQKDLAL